MWGRESCDCYMLWDLRSDWCDSAVLWRRQVTQAVDITHPLLVMILVLSCAHLHLTSHISVDFMLSTARTWSHVTVTAHSLLRVCWLSIQVRLRSRLSSSLLPLSSPGYLARLWSARLTPGQGETHNETLRLAGAWARVWVSQDSEIFPDDVVFCLKAYPTFELKYLTFEIFLYHLEHPEMQWRRVMKLCEWAYLKCLWNVYLKCLSNLYSLK